MAGYRSGAEKPCNSVRRLSATVLDRRRTDPERILHRKKQAVVTESGVIMGFQGCTVLDGSDVLQKVAKLKENLDRLGESDKDFVRQMVNLLERGALMKRDQILRIMALHVPGEPAHEESQDARIWTHDIW
jgi:hypothetical protein